MIDLIIPIYNAKNTLDLTLMSIKMQTILNKINVYLIDDCSEDNYDEIINNYKDMNIIYKKLDKNSGPAVARQVGMDISSSDYIMFIDADDLFYDADSVKKLYSEIEKGFDYVIGITYEEKRKIKIMNESDLHGKIYRRKFIEDNQIRFNNTRFHEDNYFNNLVLACEPLIKKIFDFVYIYVYNEESITNIQKEKEFERLEILLSNMRQLLDESKKRNCNREKIAYLMFIKVKYFNQIYLEFTKEQKEEFKLWIKKYNLKIEKYLDRTDLEEIYDEMLKEYSY